MSGEIKMHKNKFLTFLFAVVPGCGHMYLGYMKRGVEYMAMFAASIYLAVVCTKYRFEAIGAIFLIVLPVIWLYQMFDAIHTVSQMRRMELEFPVDDGFFIPGISHVANLKALDFFKKAKVAKTIAAILICIGVYALLSDLSRVISARFQIGEIEYYVDEIYSRVFDLIIRYIPSVAVSLLLIVGGIRLLAGNKSKGGEDGE